MDQSMVEDYPQTNFLDDIAKVENEKYPMAGRTSHEVSVGIYNVQNKKTIYLNTGNPCEQIFHKHSMESRWVYSLFNRAKPCSK